MQKKQQDQSQIKWISDFIWNIADNRLRDVYVRGKYRDVILPFTVLRRLDAVLEATKDVVLERKKFLDTHKVAELWTAFRPTCRKSSPSSTGLQEPDLYNFWSV